MITSTTTVVPRQGTLNNIKGLPEYLRTKCSEPGIVKDIYNKDKEEFKENDKYSYINEGMYINIKTYFIVISCKNKILLIETDKKLTDNGKIIDLHFVELNENNAEQFRKYNETKGKSGMHFT